MAQQHGLLFTMLGSLIVIAVAAIADPGVTLTALSNEDIALTRVEKPNSVYQETTEYQDCPEVCNFTRKRIECIDCMPRNVTSTVKEIVISNFNESRFVPKMFCGVSWPSVGYLTIINSKVRGDDFYIQNFTFDCLSKIQTLKLGFEHLSNFSLDALYGLVDVRTLDLTDCIRLDIPGIVPGLSLATSVPLLQTLILSKVGIAYYGLQISQEFVDIIADRKISNLDMSFTTVSSANPYIDVSGICKCVEELNLTNSNLAYLKQVNMYNKCTKLVQVNMSLPCDSLRVIDVSAVIFPGAKIHKGNITVPPGCYAISDNFFDFLYFFRGVSIAYANNIISADHYIYVNNVTVDLLWNNSLTEIHVSGYSIPVLEGKLRIYPNRVEYVDMSNNKIERIGPDVLANFEYLKIIDLSNNRLAISHKLENTFSKLFRNNSKLEIAMLSNNGLNCLPSQTFESNIELKKIDLSRNAITQIPFKISHLLKLKLLNLRGNAVEYLNGWSRHQIDTLYKRKQERQNTTYRRSFTLDLRDNKFSCKCQSLEFIKWFIDSPVFAGHRSSYFCELNGKQIPMGIDAIAAAQDDCERPKRQVRRLLLIVLLPCVLTAILVVLAIVAFKRYKRNRLYRRLREHIDLIHEDQLGYRFPVFLSYASQDSQFVETNILQPLEAKLKNLTKCDRNLVAIGDRYFRLGRSIFAEIIRMLEDCAVIVVVLSKNYCNSDYCKHEIEQARLMRKPIVIIMKEFVDESDMNGVIKETFKHFTRATFRFDGEGFRLEQDWEYICQSIIQLL